MARLASRERFSFSKLREVKDLPNLIEVQTDSFHWFLEQGVAEVLRDISPIEDFTGQLKLELTEHVFDPPKHSEDECRERDMTYARPLFVTARFMNAGNCPMPPLPLLPERQSVLLRLPPTTTLRQPRIDLRQRHPRENAQIGEVNAHGDPHGLGSLVANAPAFDELRHALLRSPEQHELPAPRLAGARRQARHERTLAAPPERHVQRSPRSLVEQADLVEPQAVGVHAGPYARHHPGSNRKRVARTANVPPSPPTHALVTPPPNLSTLQPSRAAPRSRRGAPCAQASPSPHSSPSPR